MGRPQLTTSLEPLAERVRAAGRRGGLARVGITSAEPFTSTRRLLLGRRRQGLHGGMAFTYRNPVRSTEPALALAGVERLVVGALAYGPGPGGGGHEEPAGPGPRGRVARYARGDEYGALRDALGGMAEVLEHAGYRTRVLADDNALVDRAAAVRAGIGWYGRSTSVLVPELGPWVVLGAVLTDAPLPCAEPFVADGCGPCHRCLAGCPTGAITKPGVLDARRCLAWLLQVPGPFPRAFRVPLGDRLYGCDDCQEACPPSRHRAGRSSPGRAGPGAWVELATLLLAEDHELLHRFGRWYVPRREPRYLRRNALVVLGNVGDGSQDESVTLLRRALGNADGLVRAHGVWAAARLGRRDLLDGRSQDPDPLVRQELALVPTVPVR